MANSGLPWAAYSALVLGRFIGLYKFPVVRLVGIGETWQRILAKYVLMVTGSEAKEACGMEQFYVGLDAVIEGGIHVAQLLCKNLTQEEDQGFHLIDVRNVSNEEN